MINGTVGVKYGARKENSLYLKLENDSLTKLVVGKKKITLFKN